MNTVSNGNKPSLTLKTMPNGSSSVDQNEAGSSSTTVVVTGTQRKDNDTTVTTVVVSSTESLLPTLTLQDVQDNGQVLDNEQMPETATPDSVQTVHSEDAQAVVSTVSQALEQAGVDSVIDGNDTVLVEVETTRNGQTVTVSATDMESAINAIDTSDGVKVEVETTNNVQTVTVSAADIEAVYTQATAQNVVSSLSNVLLLKNGWAYTNMMSSPLELPLEPAEQEPDTSWTSWRTINDGIYEIQDAVSGLWSRLVGQQVDTTPKTPEDVTGVLKNYDGDDQLLWTTTSTTTLQLSSEGIFTNTRTSLTSSTSLLPDNHYAIHTQHSATGTSSTFSGTASTPDGVQIAALSNSQKLEEIAGDSFGSFSILEDGITLELQYADGTVERQLYLQTNQGSLSIGGDRYIRKGNVSFDILDALMNQLEKSRESDLRDQWLKAIADAVKKNAKKSAASFGVNANGSQNSSQRGESVPSDVKIRK